MSDVSTTSSGMTGAGGGHMLRITGMASGLDVDAMVKKMMAAEQTKLDKAKQVQQTTQWKQDAYQDIIKDIKDLQSSFFDSNSSDKNILSSANFAPYTVNAVSGSTIDTSVATFIPGVGAQTGKYSITVAQLAEGAGVSNASVKTSAGVKASLSTKLTDIDSSLVGNIGLVLNIGGSSDISIKLNNTGTATLGDLVNAINNQSGATVKATYSELTGQFKLSNSTTGESSRLAIKAGTTANLSKVLGSGNSAFGDTGVTLDAGAAISNTAITSSSRKLTDINSSLTGSITLKLSDGSGGTATVTLDNSSGNATIKNLVDAINTKPGSGDKFTASCDASGFKLKANTDTASLSVVDGTNSGLLSVFNLTGTTNDLTLATGAGISNIAMTDSTKLLSTINPELKGVIKLKLNTGAGDDTDITLDNSSGNASIKDLVNAINAQAGKVVKASCDGNGFKLSVSTSDASNTNLKIVTGTNSGLFSIFGLTTGSGAAQEGKNADVTITPPGGDSVNVKTQTSNNFTIDGMTYTISSVSSTPASVNVGLDTTKVYNKINDFITKYNAVVDKIQTKLAEKKNKDYAPLTDSQRESMSESQIAAWETKAKAGILRNDDKLESILSDLRTAFTTAVSNTGLSFGQYGSNAIGIDMSSDVLKPGHIDIVDSGKLKEAISKNPEQILKMFTNTSTKTDGTTKYTSNTEQYKEDGILRRVKAIFEKNVGYTNVTLNTATLTSYANKQYDYSSTGTGGQGTLPDQIYEEQLLIKKIKTEMSDKQEKYYKQFSALETAMTQLSSQQSALSSMLGG